MVFNVCIQEKLFKNLEFHSVDHHVVITNYIFVKGSTILYSTKSEEYIYSMISNVKF